MLKHQPHKIVLDKLRARAKRIRSILSLSSSSCAWGGIGSCNLISNAIKQPFFKFYWPIRPTSITGFGAKKQLGLLIPFSPAFHLILNLSVFICSSAGGGIRRLVLCPRTRQNNLYYNAQSRACFRRANQCGNKEPSTVNTSCTHHWMKPSWIVRAGTLELMKARHKESRQGKFIKTQCLVTECMRVNNSIGLKNSTLDQTICTFWS